MGRINNLTKYPKDQSIDGSETVVGSNESGVTSNYELNDIAGFARKQTLYWEGYNWTKAENKTNIGQLELYDRLSGVGTYFPGYVIDAYVTTVPFTDPTTDLTIISSALIS